MLLLSKIAFLLKQKFGGEGGVSCASSSWKKGEVLVGIPGGENVG